MTLEPFVGRTRAPRPAPRRSSPADAPFGDERRAPYQARTRDLPPGLYLYRIGTTDEAGRPGQVEGVVGLLGPSDASSRLRPHEALLADAVRSEDAAETTDAGPDVAVAPIMALAPPGALADLLEPEGPPLVAVRIGDEHHRLYPITSPARIDALARALADVPLVIADGHHRAVAASRAGRPVTVFVVPADHPDLRVEPIGRRLPAHIDAVRLRDAATAFSVEPHPGGGPPRPIAPGALVVRTADGETFLLRPRREALATLPGVLRSVAAAVAERFLWPALGLGPADVAPGDDTGTGPYAWMGPVDVATVVDAAHAGVLLPAKSTRFLPKPHPDVVAG